MPVSLANIAPLSPLLPADGMQRKRWTREECEQLEKAGIHELQNFELIEGELIRKMSKLQLHNHVVFLLCNWLRRTFGNDCVAQEVSIDVAPADIPASEPEPDVIVTNRPYGDLLPNRARPEDIRLLAEVSDSTLQFDLTRKAGLYARAGIPEYWVVDLRNSRLVVHRDPAGGAFQSISAFEANEAASPLGLAGSAIRVADLFKANSLGA